MDFLNKAASQASDLFKGMTPGSRLTAGMLLVMIVVSLVYLVSFNGGKADRYIYGGQEFSDEDIARIVAAFSAEKLDEYDHDGRRIRVPGGKFSTYTQALNKAGFTPSLVDDVTQVGSGLFDSEADKARKDIQYKQVKLSRALSKLPNVDWSTVQYQEVKTRGFPPQVERNAAVLVCGKNNLPLDDNTMGSIRATTAAWFAIDKTNVAVKDTNGGMLTVGEPQFGIDDEAEKYLITKRKHEEHFRNKILNCLSYIGPGVVAAVNVELEPYIKDETEKFEVDPQSVPYESETERKTEENRPVQGGRPGASPNEVQGMEPRTLVTSNQQQSTLDESREQQRSITGQQVTRQEKAPFITKMVTATVSIPRSYFRGVWLAEQRAEGNDDPGNPTTVQLTEVENRIITQVEDNVVNTLPPLEAGEDQYPLVEVSSHQDLPVEEPEPPSAATSALAWLSDNWKTLGLFGVGLISLLVLRSMLRAPRSSLSTAAANVPLPEPTTEEEEEVDEEPQIVLHRKSHGSGLSLREELISMVREDPDAAASVLRTWIGDAA